MPIRTAQSSLAVSQVVERLAKASEKRDLLVLNFGLHFSEAYEEELKLLVQQVMTRHAPPMHPVESMVTPCASQCLLVRAAEDAQLHVWRPDSLLSRMATAQVLQLRRDGDFPFLLWKDTAPQHFESTYGEYPQVSTVTPQHGSTALGGPYGCSSRCPYDLVVLYLETYLSHWGLLPL